MIRHRTSRIFNGKRVKPDEVVHGTLKQKQELVDCGQAYDDGIEIPTMSNTKDEIHVFMDSMGIEYEESMTKEELLKWLA